MSDINFSIEGQTYTCKKETFDRNALFHVYREELYALIWWNGYSQEEAEHMMKLKYTQFYK